MWNVGAIDRSTARRGTRWAGCLLVLSVVSAQPSPGQGPEAGSQGRDPRIFLIEKQVERNFGEALAAVEQTLAADPAGARDLGLEYLYGHLLSRLGRDQEALEAFAAAMGSTPRLGAYSRYRLAVVQESRGHPEIAAGLVATLLGSNPPRELALPAMALLERTLAAGGDCRLLPGLEAQRWNKPERRYLALASGGCALREGALERARDIFFRVLEEERGDHVARSAVEKLLEAYPPGHPWKARANLLFGLTFYNHREFRRATHHLARSLVQIPSASDVSSRERFECRYALARSHFWLGRYAQAAAAFEALARDSPSSSQKAQASYQRGRSLELLGDWPGAIAAYQGAYNVDPRNRRWADAALISLLRLRWLTGDPQRALEAYERLVAQRKLATATRALIFLASSELASPAGAGTDTRVEGWLNAARQSGKAAPQELRYWLGRWEEARSRPQAAAEHYFQAMLPDPFHPFGVWARRRLESGPIRPIALSLGRQLALSDRADELYAASLLLAPDDPRRDRVRRSLRSMLTTDEATAPYLEVRAAPADRWPLWDTPLRRPEEMLLALGLFDEASSVVLRHFPASSPDLALTGSLVLWHSGETRQSLYIAEILAKRIPGQVPSQVLDPAYRRLLFPWSYGELIVGETAPRGVDPFLLAAIIREESRFDPKAFSAASARGLTQFIYPTARRIAEKIGIDPIAPRDLEKPGTAIALGAAYLEELLDEFDGLVPQVVAAYNAGEPQADLWRRYCSSDEPEEYLSKVSFSQTRLYVTKVLTSREHYSDLHRREVPSTGGLW